MELIAIEVILWVVFGLLLWVIKHNVQSMEADLRHSRLQQSRQISPRHSAIAIPQRLIEPIGRYLGQPIYHYAIIDGKHYQFDFACPKELVTSLSETQRCIAPGLVYIEAPIPSM
jgi:hypothetical protein